MLNLKIFFSKLIPIIVCPRCIQMFLNTLVSQFQKVGGEIAGVVTAFAQLEGDGVFL